MLFFFQAEDGIRDWSVTGVQTCALPISPCTSFVHGRFYVFRELKKYTVFLSTTSPAIAYGVLALRSEERRVGKECRVQWSPTRYRKKRRACALIDRTASPPRNTSG